MEQRVGELISLEEGKKKEVSTEEAFKLLELTAENNLPVGDLVYLLDVIATFANSATNRGAFATAGMKPLVTLLHHPVHEVIVHVLKTIGTLAFDNQIKSSLLDLGIVPVALDLAKGKDFGVAVRATELVGHMCFGSELAATTFLAAGAYPVFLALATQTENLPLRYSAIRAMGSMADKTAKQNIGGGFVLDFLLPLLGKPDTLQDQSLLYEIIRVLSVVIQQNPAHTKSIISGGGLASLLAVVNKFYRASSAKAEHKKDEEKKEKEVKGDKGDEDLPPVDEQKSSENDEQSPDVVASDLLVAIADDDALRLPFLENGRVPDIARLLELPVGNVRVTRNLLKVFARLSVNDGCMQHMFQHTTTVLKLLGCDDMEVQLAAILVIGNLARTEENVTKLIEMSTVDTLLNFIKTSSTNNTPLTHVCVNCLRNFSISVHNKKRLGEGQVIQTLIYLLPHENPLVQFATVVALKNLLIGCDPNVDIFLRENGLPALITVANDKGVLSDTEGETEEEKLKNADKRVQYECTRILVKLVENEDIRKLVVKLKGIKPMVELMGCEHEVLRIEGSRGLMHVASVDENRPIIVQEAGGAEALVRIFAQHEDLVRIIQSNEEFTAHCASIFNSLAKNEQSRTALLAANVVPVLKTISKSSSAKSKPLFVETLSILTC